MTLTYYVIAHKYKEDIFYDPAGMDDETPYFDETQLFPLREIAEKHIKIYDLEDFRVMEVEICQMCNKIEDDCWCGNQN
ncbi:hypothetical protein ACQVN8_25510 [Bacillus paranthracis]|uniref:hypothetical protein n=1 Tax=Bacillus paranthracis TaxID=2026186 RepID=UPI003D65BAD3